MKIVNFHTKLESPAELPKPEEIKKILDEYVIGQEDAKNIGSCSIQSL